MKRTQRHNFTLFEMLISIGLLVVLSVVLLRTFALVSDFWRTTNNQTLSYADANVTLSNISEELSNIIYNYEASGDEKKLKAPIYVGEQSVTPACFSGTSNSVNKGKVLCFLTRTQKGEEEDNTADFSNICKVAYIFYPPIQDETKDHSGINVDDEPNGVLVRTFLNENDYSLDSLKGTASMGQMFAFGSASLDLVISNVVDFNITGYKFKNPSDLSQGLEKVTSFNTAEGGKDLVAIYINMRLMQPEMLKEFRNRYVLEKTLSDEEKNNENKKTLGRLEFLKKHSQVFTKAIWITPMKDND